MPTRPEKDASARRSASRRAREGRKTADAGAASAGSRRKRKRSPSWYGGGAEPFDPGALFGSEEPLARLGRAFALLALEWQSVALEAYRGALRGMVSTAPPDDQLRAMVRSMMAVYLDLVKSAPERRERLLAAHAELAATLSAAVEDLRRRVGDARP
jgi:hypothetical protein